MHTISPGVARRRALQCACECCKALPGAQKGLCTWTLQLCAPCWQMRKMTNTGLGFRVEGSWARGVWPCQRSSPVKCGGVLVGTFLRASCARLTRLVRVQACWRHSYPRCAYSGARWWASSVPSSSSPIGRCGAVKRSRAQKCNTYLDGRRPEKARLRCLPLPCLHEGVHWWHHGGLC